MQVLLKQTTHWIKTHKIETTLLVGILILASCLRLYRIAEYMTFLGDEGRDAIIVRNLLVHADPILIGPGTSIGNMYLGPLYYYLIAPFLFLANFSPAGPSIMIALFGIATVFLVWKMGREWFGPIAGFVTAFFFAIAPVIIIYNRSSWNPNIMPFFSTLCIYAVWRIWNKHEFKWLIVLGISFAFVMQSHYLGLILAPVCGLFLLLTLLSLRGTKQSFNVSIAKSPDTSAKRLPHVPLWRNIRNDESSNFWKNSIIGTILFLLLMSPLLLFDIRHNFMNFNAIKTFFTVRQDTVSANPFKSLKSLWPIWEQISTRLLGGTDTTAGRWIAFGLFDGTLALLIMKKIHKKNIPLAYWLLLTWILLSLFGLAAYKHELYDHYYGFLFTAPFLLLGGITQDVIETFKNRNLLSKTIAYCLLLSALIPLTLVNIYNSPLQYSPNRQLQRSIAVSQKIEEEAHGQKLNLAVIAERNYEGAYQYFLEKDNSGFVKIDPLDTEDTITEQLFVVCELPEEKCDPTHNPKTEVANFGWSEVDKQWNVDGVILYKLVHTEQ
jgi:4-amino-4-deoxy-L-arabinose transferase-like glycosyltransferase